MEKNWKHLLQQHEGFIRVLHIYKTRQEQRSRIRCGCRCEHMEQLLVINNSLLIVLKKVIMYPWFEMHVPFLE